MMLHAPRNKLTNSHPCPADKCKAGRKGAAIIAAIVAIALIGILLASITWQIVAERRYLERRHQQTQLHWLVRAGFERALARLQTAKEELPLQETWNDGAGGKVTMKVESRAETPTIVDITCEAVFPDDAGPDEKTARRSERRTYQRGGGQDIHLRRIDTVQP